MAEAVELADPRNATVVEKIMITPSLAIFRVKPDHGEIVFTPGQFTVLGLPYSAPRLPGVEAEEVAPEKAHRLIRRAYSISSGNRDTELLEFYISMVRSGELTPRLFQLQEGDRLFVGNKFSGIFTLDRVTQGKNILMVATGTGLAPYMSMVRSHVLAENPVPHAIAILHGAAHSWDLGYREALESLQLNAPGHFRYLPVVSRPQVDTTWRGRTGRLIPWLEDPALAEGCGFPLQPEQTDIFLCGNPQMAEEAIRLLEERGYTQGSRQAPGTLHVEKYW